jgi:hypothetical protein
MESKPQDQLVKVTTASIKKCPKCGGGELFRQAVPGGQTEVICLDMDCDFAQVVTEAPGAEVEETGTFADRLCRLADDELQSMAQRLREGVDTSAGRARRVVQHQLVQVQTEMKRRTEQVHPPREEPLSGKVPDDHLIPPPPQFRTPEAAEKRAQGIREYYKRKRQEAAAPPLLPGEGFDPSGPWLDSLLKALRDDAARHEQAAQSYARVPRLAALHVEHMARAHELRRIVDLLVNCTRVVHPREIRTA